jgi:glycosyltransferase involved in cell wall biosynthesis
MNEIIIVAYDLNPYLGSECGIAHDWLLSYVNNGCRLTVYVDNKHKNDILKFQYPKNISFNFIALDGVLTKILRKIKQYWILNIIFTRLVKQQIVQKKNDAKIIHCITPEGIHSFNSLYTLRKKIIIGPLGGGLVIKKGFFPFFSKPNFKEIIREAVYSLITSLALWKEYILHANTIIVGTPEVLKRIPKSQYKRTKIFFDTLVDTSIFTPINRSIKDNITILFVGRLENQKGILYLLEGFEMIKNRHENVILTIIGDGSLKNKVVQYAKNNSQVRFLGLVKKDKVIYEYQHADIFCLPSIREPGGTSILEAMACGLPIICADSGGPAYSVSSENGIKIPISNQKKFTKEIASALEKLIYSPELRIQMGRQSRKRALAYFSRKSLDTFVKEQLIKE